MEQKKSYDSEFCGSLPLHLINLIQPYGLLIVLQRSDLSIIQVSENIENFLSISARDIINQPLANYITAEEYHNLSAKLNSGVTGKIPLRLTFNSDGGTSFLSLVQLKDDYVIVEMEPAAVGSEALFTDVFQELKYAMAEINVAESTEAICQAAIRELKRLSGFDKIMVYRFDEDWNGEVVAEIMEPEMDSYLGLRFPASDVPKQARALYLKNPYRLIPTRDYTPVKIYPVINPLTHSFIDLSNCNVRSVAAVHLEYLKNMGVMASMSTAIIKDEQLWGLISCHHRTEKYLSFEVCSVFELMAGTISSRITAIQNKEQLHQTTKLQQIHARLIEQVYLDDNPMTGITTYDQTILNLLNCEGAAIFYNKKLQTIGNVPDRNELQELVLWLQTNNIDKVYFTSNLSGVYDNAVSYADIGSGIIVLPIHLEKGEFIIGFRPEVVQQVNWGGNPNEAINFEQNNITYHPRNSFKLWKQTLKHCSLPWVKDELAIAENFRNFLIEYTLKKVYAMM